MATINGKPKIIKEINMALVRKNIIRHSPITKPELSKLLGLSLPTVNKCVDELLEKEIVKVFEGEIQVKGSGKKPIFYEINSDHVSYIAVYFKGTILTVREYNLLGKIKNEKVKKLKEDSDEKVLISVLDKIIKESKNKENIEAISIGVAGIVEENGSAVIIDPCRRCPGDLYVKFVEYTIGCNITKYIFDAEQGKNVSFQEMNAHNFIIRHCIMTNKIGVYEGLDICPSIRKYIIDSVIWAVPGETIDDCAKYKAGILFLKFDTFDEIQKILPVFDELVKIKVK